MRILFGWEFGAGLGHINRIKPIARALREKGAEIFLALQETERADAFHDPQTGRLPDGYHLLLSDAFHGERSFPLTLSIVDPYAPHREGETVPAPDTPTDLTPLAKEFRLADSVVFYMPHWHPFLKLTVDALKQSGLHVLGYISGIHSDAADKNSTARFRISPTPLPFKEIIPKARLAVHHGGLSTAVACTMAGTPQTIFPFNLEHLVTARRIATLGATHVLSNPANEYPRKTLAEFFSRSARDDALLAKAIAAAGTMELTNRGAGLQAIIAACEDLTGQNPGR